MKKFSDIAEDNNLDLIPMRLDSADAFAKCMTGCTKVDVGCLIVTLSGEYIFGANIAVPDLCKTKRGCLRVEKYGDDSKNHRLPADCRAVHSEVHAICKAAKSGVSIAGATIHVTRYPCEACARAIVTAGISKVYYGRQQEISEETKAIFESANVYCEWRADWVLS